MNLLLNILQCSKWVIKLRFMKNIQIIHYCSPKEKESILKNGWNPPKNEAIIPWEQGFQNKEDVVSFGVQNMNNHIWKKMKEEISKIDLFSIKRKNKPDEITEIKLVIPRSYIKRIGICTNPAVKEYGIEIVIDRKEINDFLLKQTIKQGD